MLWKNFYQYELLTQIWFSKWIHAVQANLFIYFAKLIEDWGFLT